MRRVRSVMSVLLGLLAVIGLLASVLALWARDVLFDETRVGGAVESALEQQEVVDSLASQITDRVFLAVDVEARLAELLPANLSGLAPALVGGVRTRVEEQVASALSSDEARTVLVGVVEGAHRSLMRLLDGDGVLDGVTVQDGEVTVNLLPLLTFGLSALQDVGYLDRITVPQFTADGDPAAQQAELETLLGRDLPDQFGQLVVYRSDALSDAGETLATAQRTIVLVKRAIVLVVLVTVLCFAGSILLARRRRRAILVLALGSSAMFVVARAIINRVVEKSPSLAIDPGARAAIAASVTDLASGLLAAVTMLLLIGVVACVAAYLSGPSERARSVRRSMGSGTQHRDVMAIVAFAAAVAVIGFAGIGGAQVVVALLFVALGAAAMWWPGRVATE